jgi:taurine transport system permease protein
LLPLDGLEVDAQKARDRFRLAHTPHTSMCSPNLLLRRHARLIVGALSVLCGLALWQTATSWRGWIRPLFLASPVTLGDAFVSSLREAYGGATLPQRILVSLGEVVAGFAGGVAVGIPLGVCMGWSPLVGRMMSPFFNTIRQIPPLSWVPLAVVWFGIGFAPKAFVIFCTVMARGAEMLANGKTSGVTVPGAIVATPKFATRAESATS